MGTRLPKNSSVFVYEFMIDGATYRGSTRCKTKRDADRVEAKRRAEVMLNAGNRKKPLITLDEAAGIYEDRLRANNKWSKTMDYLIANIVDGVGGGKYLSDITQTDLSRHFAKRAGLVSGASVNREIEVARPIWRNLRKTHDIGEMPEWADLRYAVTKKAPRELYHSEEDALFVTLREDFRDFTDFALKSGWRLSEVRYLRWADLNMGEGVATTRVKGGDVITRALSQDLKVLIANQPKAGPFVFTYICQKTRSAFVDVKGRNHPARLKGERYPFTQWGWRRPWAKALKDAGIDAFRFHDLRHTRGTRILRHTGNLQVAAKVLGHSNLNTTRRYAHAADDDVRRALDASESRSIPAVDETASEKRQKTGEN